MGKGKSELSLMLGATLCVVNQGAGAEERKKREGNCGNLAFQRSL